MSDWDEAGLKDDRELRFADAKKLSAPFSSWPSMCTAFARLNNSKFTDTSDDYRNRLHHGFPRRIELVHIMTIQRDPKSFVYRICDQPPLFISDLVPLLADQYQAAVDCYVAYVALVREQRGFWAPRAGSVDATAEQRAASATSLSRT